MKPDSLLAQRLIVGVALAVLGAAFSLNVYLEYSRVEKREQDRLLTQAHVIQENTGQALLSINLALKDVGERFASHESATDLTEYLKAMADGMPSTRTVSVIDRTGKIIASSRKELVGFDASRRAYFREARGTARPDMLYISNPFVSALNVYTLSVSRMLPGPRGEFNGIVTATLDPGYFSPLLDSVRYAQDMTVSLIQQSAPAFLVMPKANALSEGEFLQRTRALERHISRGSGTTVFPREAFDDAKRMLLLRSVDFPDLKVDRPLVVAVDRDVSEVYARWRHDASLLGILYGLILAASILSFHLYQKRVKSANAAAAAAVRALEEGERFMKTMTDHLPALVGYWTHDLRCRFANGAYRDWFGREPQTMRGMHIRDLLGEKLFRENAPYIIGVLEGKPQQFERTLTRADGSIAHTLAQYIPDMGGDLVKGFFVLVSDVTQLKEVQMALSESEWKLKAIIENEPECVALISTDGTLQQMNPAGMKMIAAESDEEVIGTRFGRLVVPRYQAAFQELIAEAGKGKHGEMTFELTGFTGMHRWLECRAVPMRSRHGDIVAALCVMRDITARKKAEEELAYLAQTDFLTGLANRRHFMSLAERELARSRRYGSPVTILMMDIDHFKRINDAYGHKAGDEVLRRFADLCRSSLRSLDIVGRIGGEEFAVLLPETDSVHALQVAELLRERVESTQVSAGAHEAIRFTISIGVASRADMSISLEALLAEADAGLYRAKNSGRNRICEYRNEKNFDPLRLPSSATEAKDARPARH